MGARGDEVGRRPGARARASRAVRPDTLPTPRHERRLIEGAARWLKAERKRLGWTQKQLAERAARLAGDFRLNGYAPTLQDVRTLERGQVDQLPRWLKLAHYAIEHAEFDRDTDNGRRLAWLADRNWHFAGHPFDGCHPFLFRDESYFIGELYQLPEAVRRALRRFTRDFAGPYVAPETAARQLLADLSVDLQPSLPDEDQLLILYRQLPEQARREALAALSRLKHPSRAVR